MEGSMNKNLDWLDTFEPETEQDTLEQLSSLVQMHKALVEQKEEIEGQLKQVNENLRKVEQEEIPNLLLQNGLSRIKLKSGEEVKVTPDVQVSVNKARWFDFVKFLKERGDDDIIKLKVAFDRMKSEQQEALYNFLNESNYPYSADDTVHPQTLKKYIKVLTGMDAADYAQGLSEGRYIAKENLPSFIRVFDYFKTSIK